MNIGAVIVTHNSADTLLVCIKSLRLNQIQHIVAVDNASTDNTHAVISSLPVTPVLQSANNGFASACNVGAAYVPDKYLLFINPDARLPDQNLSAAEEFLESNPSVGILGLMLYRDDGKPEPSSFGGAPTLFTLVTRHLHSSRSYAEPTDITWVSGGAMIVRRQTFQELGGFDPTFFLYWEDVDLCQRARSKGWRVMTTPHVKVIHRHGVSLTDQTHKTELYDASADRYFRKHYSTPIWQLQRSLRRIYRFFSPQARF